MTQVNRSDLDRILKQRRVATLLSLRELSAKSGVSSSHLSRIERGERLPSPGILQKLSQPLGFEERELLKLAGYLSHRPPSDTGNHKNYSLRNGLDPYVATMLAQEPVKTQRTVFSILSTLKHIASSIAQETSGGNTGGTAATNISCELLSTCPYFNDRTQEMSGMTEMDKEQYCQGDYTWCGRYMTAKALERGLERTNCSEPISKSPPRNKVNLYKR